MNLIHTTKLEGTLQGYLIRPFIKFLVDFGVQSESEEVLREHYYIYQSLFDLSESNTHIHRALSYLMYKYNYNEDRITKLCNSSFDICVSYITELCNTKVYIYRQ